MQRNTTLCVEPRSGGVAASFHVHASLYLPLLSPHQPRISDAEPWLSGFGESAPPIPTRNRKTGIPQERPHADTARGLGGLENVTPEPPGAVGVSPSWPDRVGLEASPVCSEGGVWAPSVSWVWLGVPRGSKKGPTLTRTHSLSPHAFFAEASDQGSRDGKTLAAMRYADSWKLHESDTACGEYPRWLQSPPDCTGPEARLPGEGRGPERGPWVGCF